MSLILPIFQYLYLSIIINLITVIVITLNVILFFISQVVPLLIGVNLAIIINFNVVDHQCLIRFIRPPLFQFISLSPHFQLLIFLAPIPIMELFQVYWKFSLLIIFEKIIILCPNLV